ncbi:polysaccharide deacetylase family protein [Geomesophilobacter sediminis]|uniref:Polysaccharide deacetylase family protein n=1 Tax=Geomesophilobacter sediminis TaxID=2798584 RepID=A0A8J7IN13_9BACT|nr:polysaccharide deacetylase family protein [Geomesophilobacter sediminis]MBJ6723304.1 polysaccharide deacetylase family protein [Geomesophilobacter sediminis]
MKKSRLSLLLIVAMVAASLTYFALSAQAQNAAPQAAKAAPAPTAQGVNVPILLYHRFGPAVVDGMTIKTSVFEEHLKYLRDNGYKVIPLRALVNWYLKKGPAPAPKSVVIVEDDAHKSVYSDMLPLVKKYNVPVTMFVYPSAISNAKYALTWDQIRTLKKTGLFDIQSHTFWHPNFRKDKKKMTPAEYEKSVHTQLTKSKDRLEKQLGDKIDMLAWPFGIYDDYLLKKAGEAGYIATFTIEAHHATARDSVMKLPRYLLINSDQGKYFARIVEGTAPKRNIVY